MGTEFKVMQELLRHSTLRSTLDVYTQAITPAKHAAQAAVLSLVFRFFRMMLMKPRGHRPVLTLLCDETLRREKPAKKDTKKGTKTCPFGSSMVYVK